MIKNGKGPEDIEQQIKVLLSDTQLQPLLAYLRDGDDYEKRFGGARPSGERDVTMMDAEEPLPKAPLKSRVEKSQATRMATTSEIVPPRGGKKETRTPQVTRQLQAAMDDAVDARAKRRVKARLPSASEGRQHAEAKYSESSGWECVGSGRDVLRESRERKETRQEDKDKRERVPAFWRRDEDLRGILKRRTPVKQTGCRDAPITMDPKVPLFKSKKFGHLPRAAILNPISDDARPTAGPHAAATRLERGQGLERASHSAFGNKSLVLRQDALSRVPCRFGALCANAACPFQHQDKHEESKSATARPDKSGSMCRDDDLALAPGRVTFQSAQICYYHPWCEKIATQACPYTHPKPPYCRYNEDCFRLDCHYLHPMSSTLNGACPFSTHFERSHLLLSQHGQQEASSLSAIRDITAGLKSFPLPPFLKCVRPFCATHHADNLARYNSFHDGSTALPAPHPMPGDVMGPSDVSSHALSSAAATEAALLTGDRRFTSSPMITC
jgi:hypothetical protein